MTADAAAKVYVSVHAVFLGTACECLDACRVVMDDV